MLVGSAVVCATLAMLYLPAHAETKETTTKANNELAEGNSGTANDLAPRVAENADTVEKALDGAKSVTFSGDSQLTIESQDGEKVVAEYKDGKLRLDADGGNAPNAAAGDATTATSPSATFPSFEGKMVKVPFERGVKHFVNGDSITISEVRGTSEKFESGNIYWIMGSYTLSSHDRANLSAFTTAKEAKDGTGPIWKIQTTMVQRGSGKFTLCLPMSCAGWPHVSFYPEDKGESFGGLYFGTGDSVLKQWWGSKDASDSTSADGGTKAGGVRFRSLDEQRLADLAYKRLELELESLGGADLRRVQSLGYSGGVKISKAVGRAEGLFQPGDILVGLHVWPTTSLKDVADVLGRGDLAELSPLKFYAVRGTQSVDGRGMEFKAADVGDHIITGRISVNIQPPATQAWAPAELMPGQAASLRPTPQLAEGDIERQVDEQLKSDPNMITLQQQLLQAQYSLSTRGLASTGNRKNVDRLQKQIDAIVKQISGYRTQQIAMLATDLSDARPETPMPVMPAPANPSVPPTLAQLPAIPAVPAAPAPPAPPAAPAPHAALAPRVDIIAAPIIVGSHTENALALRIEHATERRNEARKELDEAKQQLLEADKSQDKYSVLAAKPEYELAIQEYLAAKRAVNELKSELVQWQNGQDEVAAGDRDAEASAAAQDSERATEDAKRQAENTSQKSGEAKRDAEAKAAAEKAHQDAEQLKRAAEAMSREVENQNRKGEQAERKRVEWNPAAVEPPQTTYKWLPPMDMDDQANAERQMLDRLNRQLENADRELESTKRQLQQLVEQKEMLAGQAKELAEEMEKKSRKNQ
jgi:hypothetical protein